MDRLLAVESAEGQPLRPEDWKFIQDVSQETIKNILIGLNSPLCVIHGLEITLDGSNLIISDGVFFDGEEVCYVQGATFDYHGESLGDIIGGSGSWLLYLIPAITTGESRTFKDASENNVWQYRRYALGYAETIPDEGIQLSSLKTLLHYISKYVEENLPTPSAGIDMKERKVTFSPDDLDQYMELIPTPGAGKVIQVISCSAKIIVTTPLNVGTQKLYVTYGTDITTPGIGEFSNGFLENPVTAIADMIPKPDRMYENQAVNVGLSLETRPSAGSASIVINVIYKIIEF